MVGRLLLRGMLIGILAGILAVGFGKIFGEPTVDRAISVEQAINQAKGEAPEMEIVSRKTQAGLGLLTAGVLYGAGLGGFFALAFVICYGRIGTFGVRATSALVATAAFVAVTIVPMLKYPANPPSVGEPETIRLRTALFFALIAIAVVAAVIASMAGRGAGARFGAWTGAVVGGATFVVLIGVAFAVMPAVNEVPDAFPAVTLWNFRIASLGMQAIVWTTLGLAFGWLAEPVLASPSPVRRPAYH